MKTNSSIPFITRVRTQDEWEAIFRNIPGMRPEKIIKLLGLETNQPESSISFIKGTREEPQPSLIKVRHR